MKMKNIQCVVCLFVLALIIVSCNINRNTDYESITSPFLTVEPEPSEISNDPVPPTPFPTISINEMEEFTQYLNSDTCKLPCFLGIVPGKTTIEDASEQLTDLGASDWREGKQYSIFTSKVLQLSLNDSRFTVWPIAHITLLYGEDNIVHQIKTVIAPYISEYWKNYSLQKIFHQYNEPDDIFMHIHNYDDYSAFQMIVSYNELGIALELSGTSKPLTVCPENENLYQLELTLTDISSELEIIRSNPSPEENWYWSPMEDVSGISKSEYFNSVMMGNSNCFTLIGNP